MKMLPQVTASSEQLPIISQNRLGVEVICGAAGSGKTSTALLRLKSLCYMFATRRNRENNPKPVHALVLTFNRTLASYVRSLAEHQISENVDVELEVQTFASWAMSRLGHPTIRDDLAKNKLRSLAREFGELTENYVVNEVEYLLGRFTPEELEQYLTAERTGRGAMPRVGNQLRRRILAEVVEPYHEWLNTNKLLDWNSLSVQMTRGIDPIGYDIAIVDESQDFSANQLRAIKQHLAIDHAITFVIDTVQRIYARGYTWAEAGYIVRAERSHALRRNHRNTREIASFAAGILDGMGVEADGALPNLEHAYANGPLPMVLWGQYQKQVDWAIKYITTQVDLTEESVAFLKPMGGNWFSLIKRSLIDHDLSFVDITRAPDWPEGPENVALCTFYSAKGLEFDHVLILGFNQEITPFGDEKNEDRIFVLRRLLAVAVARARKAVIIGCKPGEESRLTAFFQQGTFLEKKI